MLNYLNLRNYRAYADQPFHFRRLNIFIGPNNSGKSSALSAINLIAQTLKQQRARLSGPILNGQFENLGTFVDTVHGNNPRTKLGITLGVGDYMHTYEFKYRTQRREISASNIHIQEGAKTLFRFDEFSSRYNVELGGVQIADDSKHYLRPQTIGANWQTASRYSMMQLRGKESSQEQFEKTRDIERALRRADFALTDLFSPFESISPFRTPPQRTYLYSGETPESIGRTGEHGVTLLVNDFSRRGGASIDMTSRISAWLLENRIAKEIKVKALTSRHFEICLVDFKDKEHNLCDVGFGCSQVLPVLVAGLQLMGQADKSSRRPGIFLVQEPEIHLHPNAQASLGSFFTSLAHSGVQLFVETHSEYLVLRVATEVARGNIQPTDVRVFYVRDNNGEKDVTPIDLDENGVFQTEWPDGFFPHRFAETKALAAARQGRLFND